MRRIICMILAVSMFLPLFFLYPQQGFGLEGVDTLISSAPLYHFAEQLPRAESFVVEGGKDVLLGVWQRDRFVFSGLADYTQIKVSNNSYEGSFRKGIFFHPIQNAIRKLRFRNVVPGSKLVIYYGIDDAGTNFGEGAVSHLKIWLGRKELKKIRILNEKGWKKEELDLGVASFLKRKIVVTFEVTSDNIKERRLSFDAEIYP